MKRFSRVCWLLVLLSGCAGRQGPARGGNETAAGIRQGPGSETSAAEASYGAERPSKQQLRAQSAPAPRAGARAPTAGADDGALEPETEERPGLATVWGETRTSHVSSAPFTRANSDQPFAVATIHYDDSVGIRSMAAHEARELTQRSDGNIPVAGGLASVRLLDERGDPLPAFQGNGRSFVRGVNGERYALEIQNQSGTRFEIVATVDGLDVVDGRSGSYAKRGYILSPFDTLVIDGFRQSFQTVAAFRFGAVRDSYAARKGDDRNVGVIGVAFFEEAGALFDQAGMEPHRSVRETRRRLDADPFPARFAQPPAGYDCAPYPRCL